MEKYWEFTGNDIINNYRGLFLDVYNNMIKDNRCYVWADIAPVIFFECFWLYRSCCLIFINHNQ